MKQQVCYQLRCICVGNPFLHKIHILVIVTQNEHSQSESVEEEAFGIFSEKEKNLKTEIVLKRWFPVMWTRDKEKENTTVFNRKGMDSK